MGGSGGNSMRVNPIKSIASSADKDDRQEAEERRIALLLRLLKGMRVPAFRLLGLSLETQRLSALHWLNENLVVQNEKHRNFNQAKNLVKLLISSEVRRNNERL